MRIGKLAKLRSLAADIGGLTDDGLRQLAGAKQLRSLEVSLYGPAQASSAGLTVLGSLENLERLRIGGYGQLQTGPLIITDTSLVGWQGLRKLRSLRLSPCRITDAGLKSLDQIASLKQLQFVGELDVTDEGLAALGRGAKLERLVLPQTKITGTGLAAFDAAAMQALSIKNAPITYEGAEQIARFSNLVELDLSGCTIGDRELKLLVEKLPKLERLGLALTAVSDEGLSALLGHKSLRELDVVDTKLTVALMGRLLKQSTGLPGLRIWAAAPQSAIGGWSGSFQPIQVE